jgi:hypothetical protein
VVPYASSTTLIGHSCSQVPDHFQCLCPPSAVLLDCLSSRSSTEGGPRGWKGPGLGTQWVVVYASTTLLTGQGLLYAQMPFPYTYLPALQRHPNTPQHALTTPPVPPLPTCTPAYSCIKRLLSDDQSPRALLSQTTITHPRAPTHSPPAPLPPDLPRSLYPLPSPQQLHQAPAVGRPVAAC